MAQRLYNQPTAKAAAAEGTRLTQIDLDFIDFGLKIIQHESRIQREGLDKVIEAEQGVYVQPGQGEAVWVEVGLAAAALAWEAYKAYKSGVELSRDYSIVSRLINADIKEGLSLDQLVDMRNQLNKALIMGQ
ncbi:hypothetical protein [Mucilaginibacter sp.]|jgi:hypothetical protein|uniref:hypothetical protein n=1 Tax=Mucilaginibacter sp. TaxID=1882438 RepID=UPI00356169EA